MGGWFGISSKHISFGSYGAIPKGHRLMLSKFRSDSIGNEF